MSDAFVNSEAAIRADAVMYRAARAQTLIQGVTRALRNMPYADGHPETYRLLGDCNDALLALSEHMGRIGTVVFAGTLPEGLTVARVAQEADAYLAAQMLAREEVLAKEIAELSTWELLPGIRGKALKRLRVHFFRFSIGEVSP